MPGRQMITMLSVVLFVVLMLASYKALWIYQQLQLLHAPKPPISVAVATAIEQQWQAEIPAAGTLKALQGIDLSIEVPGVVTELHFESGQPVKAGQPLLQLDNEAEQAQLDIALAELRLAQQNFNRGQQLVTSRAISASEFDRLAAEKDRHRAVVAHHEAALAKKGLTAPFSGTIGIRNIDIGDYLQSGTVVASLQDTSSLYVDFYVPEQSIPLMTIGQSVRVEVSALPGQHLLGRLSAINPIVQDSTRNVLVRATLPNPQNRLLPGMFASLQVLLADPPTHLVVPQSAITYSLYGHSLFVVSIRKTVDGLLDLDANGLPVLIAEQRLIETGERRGGQVAITKGLSKGEQIVTAGQIKLTHGAPISVSVDKALADDHRQPAPASSPESAAQ
ncbi:efflux RND transporter periplasmic adaptor subunit [Pseudomonas sp. ADAK18]|uniref:efflux RND transporter periplasmic adaptor subunit n=1 Tax=Pseudomonas sp. ADAK18 TaxID=2730848 RepID=UPI00146490DF|nr:efflux RND transporter periplasmic adaptor subunit [Pseudomonas sp. ADAK18]QJI30690.1 efflux RND transporter periplasmic adaptor subunit [Pseudomonas sp. ADAK18]